MHTLKATLSQRQRLFSPKNGHDHSSFTVWWSVSVMKREIGMKSVKYKCFHIDLLYMYCTCAWYFWYYMISDICLRILIKNSKLRLSVVCLSDVSTFINMIMMVIYKYQYKCYFLGWGFHYWIHVYCAYCSWCIGNHVIWHWDHSESYFLHTKNQVLSHNSAINYAWQTNIAE